MISMQEKQAYWGRRSEANFWNGYGHPFLGHPAMRHDNPEGLAIYRVTRDWDRKLTYGDQGINLGGGSGGLESYGFSSDAIDNVVNVDIARGMFKPEYPSEGIIPDQVVADAGKTLPFPSGRFEYAMAFFLNRYLTESEQQTMLGEVCRLLGSRGEFLLIDYESSPGHPLVAGEFKPQELVQSCRSQLVDWRIEELAPTKNIPIDDPSFHGKLQLLWGLRT